MFLEQEKRNNITFINATTTFKYKIYLEKRVEGDERYIDFYFIFEDNESNHTLFEFDSKTIEYNFINSLDTKLLYEVGYYKKDEEEDEEEEGEEKVKNEEEENENKKRFDNFIKKFYIDTYFTYDKILKVFRCFLCDKNKVLFNRTNFLYDLGEELKLHFLKIIKK
jgi:hypothetical protein